MKRYSLGQTVPAVCVFVFLVAVIVVVCLIFMQDGITALHAALIR